jgi:ABC-type multidrug transport system fused ATPase/permease subunit
MLTTAQSTMDVFNQHWVVGKYNNDFESSLRLAVEYELENGEVNSDLLRSLGLRVNLDDTHGRGVYLHSRTKQLSKRKDSIIGQATRIKRIEAELDWVQQTLADLETNRGSLQTEPSLESVEAAKDSLILQQKAEIDIEGKLAQALSWAITLAGTVFVLSLIPILLIFPSMASHQMSLPILATIAGTILFGGVVFFGTHRSHETLNFHLRSQHNEDLNSEVLINELGLQIENEEFHRKGAEIEELQMSIGRLKYSYKVSIQRLSALFE